MSAYVVDRHHVIYLVKAAAAWGVIVPWRKFLFHLESKETQLMVARVLWATNIASVCHRYDTRPDDPELPGPTGETFYIGRDDLRLFWRRYDPIQVLKSIACYEYQSCELPHWEKTFAAAFCRRLRTYAIAHLPGYDRAEWGAPLPFTRIEEG